MAVKFVRSHISNIKIDLMALQFFNHRLRTFEEEMFNNGTHHQRISSSQTSEDVFVLIASKSVANLDKASFFKDTNNLVVILLKTTNFVLLI